jgi:DNA-binding transcriptional MerR regulator
MTAVVEPTPHRVVKSEAAFRTISEVAEDLDVPQHVLRFWESRFPQIKPLKRGGGRRYYRPADVQLLRRIRDLLYKDGYTIKGVQKLLRDGTLKVSDVQPSQPDLPMVEPPSGEDLFEDVAPVLQPSAAPVVVEAPFETAGPSVGLNEPQKAELRDILGDLQALRQILHRSA